MAILESHAVSMDFIEMRMLKSNNSNLAQPQNQTHASHTL